MAAPNAPADPSSRWLAQALFVAALALPLAVLGWGGVAGRAVLWPDGALPSLPVQAACAGLALVPVSCISASLLFARRCFLAFACGAHFLRGTARHLRACAGAMFAAGVAGTVVPPLVGLLASGGHRLALGLDSSQVLLLLLAAIVWKVAAVLARASDLADDLAQFV
ncbi:hypothetical protein [Rhizobacter sp. Root1221]|uniref:hypothetical protein n=1 Tax=Rhizobacter sp. Root1221 TaxID=1736433 RepID=UPI0006FE8DDF|nr:hypothetical protein [Rhizobacter sp. Root1221]KQV86729.1 hypothetical protein ASC87_29350 [Rhizobacter sp. Root1221]